MWNCITVVPCYKHPYSLARKLTLIYLRAPNVAFSKTPYSFRKHQNFFQPWFHAAPSARRSSENKKRPLTKIIASGNPLRALQNMKTLPLTGFETGIAFTDDVNFTLASNDLTVTMALLRRFQWRQNLHHLSFLKEVIIDWNLWLNLLARPSVFTLRCLPV